MSCLTDIDPQLEMGRWEKPSQERRDLDKLFEDIDAMLAEDDSPEIPEPEDPEEPQSEPLRASGAAFAPLGWGILPGPPFQRHTWLPGLPTWLSRGLLALLGGARIITLRVLGR